MIPAPITVFPAEGRAAAAQAGAPPGGESGFGAWLESIAPPGEAVCDQPVAEVSLPEDEVTVEEGEADVAVIPFGQTEPPPMATPGLGGGMTAFAGPDGRADVGIADFGIGEEGAMPPAKPSTDAGPALAELAEAGEVVPFERARAEAMGQEGVAKMVASAEQAPVVVAQVPLARNESPAPPSVPAAPPPVARQVADAILTIDGDSTEIVLTPPELGTVRIVIARDQHGLVVTLTAERPEALDLLRRHADLLRQELSLQGDEAARLDFMASGQGEGGKMGGRNAWAGAVALPGRRDDGSIQPEPMPRPVAMQGRIDMRI